jgi:hypothetical protein
MKKLLLLFFIVFLFFAAPTIPFFPLQKENTVHAAILNWVFGDGPGALDKCLLENDVNGFCNTIWTTVAAQSGIYFQTFGATPGLTTNKTDAAYLQKTYQESLAGYSEVALAQIYANPPANTYAFVKDMGQSLGFIPKSAYAQGIGFSGLSVLLPIWKVFRNIAYLLLALFMIVIGFLIMFRQKIDPKTVVTVQNALPNIVITLLLITFSYAIVGILIDFMYLVIMVAISILDPISKGVIDSNTVGQFTTGSFVDVGWKLFLGGQDTFVHGILPFFGLEIPGVNVPFTMGGIFKFFTPTSLTDLVTKNVATAGSLLVGFFLACAFLFAIIRLLFMLISAYIQIIMSLLISPFQLLLGAFPGNHAFEGWIKNLIANISVFPITAIMILIGSILVKYGETGTKLWAPPMLNAGGVGGMTGIVAIGVLLGIPSVAGSIKEAMKAKPMINAGGAIGQMISSPTSTAMQGINLAYQMKMLTGKSVLDVFKIGGEKKSG